jgi:hypothetical protein
MVLKARIAGWCYLSVIAGGLFAEAVVRGSLIVEGDPAATARQIADHATLWRWGLLVHLLYLLPALTVNVLVYELFKPVQATLARLALACAVVAVAIEAMALLQVYEPLVLADDTQAYDAAVLFDPAFALSLALFAGFCALVGVLILRSDLVPRPIGGLMLLAGACYLVDTAALIVAPDLAAHLMPAILLPCLVGELSLALYFVVRGVRAPSVDQRAAGQVGDRAGHGAGPV